MSNNTLTAIVLALRIISGTVILGIGVWLILQHHPGGGWIVLLGWLWGVVNVNTDGNDE